MFSGIIETNFSVIKGASNFFIPKYFFRCAYVPLKALAFAFALSDVGAAGGVYGK